jgi:hypothetical protein
MAIHPRKSKNLQYTLNRPKKSAINRLKEPITDPILLPSQVERVREALDSAQIHIYRHNIEGRISIALANAIEYKNNRFKPYTHRKLTKNSFGAARKKGAHSQELVRLMLIHSLFWAWRKEFKREPTINRKIVTKDQTTIRSPFVVFARDILAIANIGKPEDHMATYRSYEDAIYRGLTYDKWVKERHVKIQNG